MPGRRLTPRERAAKRRQWHITRPQWHTTHPYEPLIKAADYLRSTLTRLPEQQAQRLMDEAAAYLTALADRAGAAKPPKEG